MRLVDLHPKWWAEAGRQGQGIVFDCPGECCQRQPEHLRARLSCAFANPLDGGAPFQLNGGPRELWAAINPEQARGNIVPPGYLWQRTGEDFESLTLFPSIDFSRAGHLHGFVTGGDVR